jgi:outer membrane protein OmpA-like peptidoglycan-associated protein
VSTVRAALRTLGAATAAGALLAATPTSASVAVSAADDIPILGQAMTQGIVESGPPAVITVHGVRRVENATILYWSLGIPQGSEAEFAASYLGPASLSFGPRRTGAAQGDVALTDGDAGLTYRPLQPTGKFGSCVCGPSTTMTDYTPGRAEVIWSAVAPLPPTVTSVDVTVAEQLIPNVPVSDGPMLPLAQNQEAPFVLGMGWPEPDPTLLAEAVTTQPAAYELVERVSNLEQSVTTSTGEVSLASDVLFAKDSATLTPKGRATVADAAAQIKATDTGTALTVTGHADSDASDAYNLSLSQKRAQAVAAALTKALGTGYTVKAVGKGESEPIASNKTEAGKAKNRRVSITYTGGQ